MMVESRKCENQIMTDCNEGGCQYKPPKQEEYVYNYNLKIVTYECRIQKQEIVAENSDQAIFHNPLSNCKANDLFCSLHDSIVIWPNITSTCQYTKIYYGKNFTIAHKKNKKDLLYSTNDRLTFEMHGKINECGMRMYNTTTDLKIIFENDNEAQGHVQLEWSKKNISFGIQHDVNNMLLSENDFESFQRWEKHREIQHNQLYANCRLISTIMMSASSIQDDFTEIPDLNGENMKIFVSNGLLYLPKCIEIEEIKILINTTECFKDQPIQFRINGTNRDGFITRNN
jgi:hypothetical protein